MPESCITSFRELHDLLAVYRNEAGWIFRGHTDARWKLVPKIARGLHSPRIPESVFYDAWKRAAGEYLPSSPANEWDWLALAQHHGLATRLLDWTTRPLIACFFAAWGADADDGAIYAYKINRQVDTREAKPLEHKGISCFRPSRVVPRITRRGGLFTVHGPPDLNIEDGLQPGDMLHRILVAGTYKREMLCDLHQYGVNAATVFPNLPGLACHFNWISEKADYWLPQMK